MPHNTVSFIGLIFRSAIFFFIFSCFKSKTKNMLPAKINAKKVALPQTFCLFIPLSEK